MIYKKPLRAIHVKKLCKLNPEDTILTALNKMSEAGKHGSVIPSLAFVESEGVLVGSVSDGDIRKLIGSNDHDHPWGPIRVSMDILASSESEFSNLYILNCNHL